MEVFTVAFFGHRYVDNFFTVENKLEEVIRDYSGANKAINRLVFGGHYGKERHKGNT